jgi:hypothetical protein
MVLIRRLSVSLALVLAACALMLVLARGHDRTTGDGFGGGGGVAFVQDDGIFLQEGEEVNVEDSVATATETEAEAEAEAEADVGDAVSAEDEFESTLDTEAEEDAELEADDAEGAFTDVSDAEAALDEDEFDLDLDEETDAELDAEAQHTLQQYAELSGAVDDEADADSETEAEAEAEANAAAAIGALSAESALADLEKDAKKAPKGSKSSSKKLGPAKLKRGGGGLKLAQLNLRDERGGRGAKIHLGQGKGRYSMGTNPAGVWSVDMEGRTVMSVAGKSGVVRVRGDMTVWNTLRANSLTLNRVPQWKLVRQDTFEKFVPLPKRPTTAPMPHSGKSSPTTASARAAASSKSQLTISDARKKENHPSLPPPNAAAIVEARANGLAAGASTSLTAADLALIKKARGWLYDDVIKCNGFSMLAAKPGRTITTTYRRLPKHTQIRITATVHFVDDWQGETAWMKFNDFFVWTESLDQKNVAGKFSMCGSDLYPESRFSAPIDVTWPHKANSLTISLGSNLDEGSDARFGLSNIAVYTRDASRKRKRKPKKGKCLKKGKDGKCLKRAAPNGKAAGKPAAKPKL